MNRTILYTGFGSFGLFELGVEITGSKERLADDDLKFSIDKSDIVETDDDEIFKVLSIGSVKIWI